MDKFILKYANLSYSIKDVQKRLNFLGYPTVEDGVLGEKTKQSIKNS
jgi:peptidoglycan hydrolase-like protein with peptidoglycan-binding domain